MPEIYQNIKPEHLLIMGKGNEGFNSILGSILPLMKILPQFKEELIPSQVISGKKTSNATLIENVISKMTKMEALKAKN